MLISAIPPQGGLSQWITDLFNQIRPQQPDAASPAPAGMTASITPVIAATVAASAAPPSKPGIYCLTACYGPMVLQAELAVPGAVGPFSVASIPSFTGPIQATGQMLASRQINLAYHPANPIPTSPQIDTRS